MFMCTFIYIIFLMISCFPSHIFVASRVAVGVWHGLKMNYTGISARPPTTILVFDMVTQLSDDSVCHRRGAGKEMHRRDEYHDGWIILSDRIHS